MQCVLHIPFSRYTKQLEFQMLPVFQTCISLSVAKSASVSFLCGPHGPFRGPVSETHTPLVGSSPWGWKMSSSPNLGPWSKAATIHTNWLLGTKRWGGASVNLGSNCPVDVWQTGTCKYRTTETKDGGKKKPGFWWSSPPSNHLVGPASSLSSWGLV